MAASEPNGPLQTSNGHTNGYTNGHAKGVNAKAAGPTKRVKTTKRKNGFTKWIVGAASRLLIWYTIATVLFRCPSTHEACDESSPAVCDYYFRAKTAIAPHVQPHYEQYAAPYVEVAQPYYDAVNGKLLSPVRSYAVQYGGPWATKARDQSYAQWEKYGQPQLARTNAVVQENYDKTLAPHVRSFNQQLGPYLEIARTNVWQAYYEYIVPSYRFAQPYAVQAYDTTSDFTKTTALPAAWWTWNKSRAFLDSAVWPHIRLIYLQNVEPQLIRIGERLGRYKTKVKAKSTPKLQEAENILTESSFSKPTQASVSSSSSVAEATHSAVADEAEFISNPVEAPPATGNESDKRKKVREMVAEDLELWQTKFAEQADEGANDMEDRIDDIAKRMVDEHAQVKGKELMDVLENTIRTQTDKLKETISSIVSSASDTLEDAEGQAVQAVRAAGVTIKEQAKAVRDWRQSYDAELHDTVVRAADVHFQILDETRNLALQKIGMKWAWADGVTYKDWEKYHELKSTLREWTEQLKQLIVSHPSLLTAQEASAQIEDESMEMAAAAAKELGRLKEVAHYKIVAKDATDNYETEAMRLAADAAEQASLAAAAASQKAAEAKAAMSSKAAEAEALASEGVANAKSSFADKFDDASSAVSDNMAAASSAASSVADDVTSSVAGTVSAASAKVDDQSTAASQSVSSILVEAEKATDEARDELSETSATASSKVAEALSVASESASNAGDSFSGAADDVSSAAEDTASIVSESMSSFTDDAASSVSSFAESEDKPESSFMSEAPEAFVGDAESIVDHAGSVVPDFEIEEDPSTEKDDTPIADHTASVKPAFLGAAAQAVSDRKPILDDYDESDANDIVSRGRASAEAAYNDAVAAAKEQYASAASVVSAQIYGTPKPVHEELLSSLSAGYDGAVAAASSRWNDVISGVKPTTTAPPAPTAYVDWSKVESIASQRLQEGRLWAELQYQSAVIALGLSKPTPSSVPDKYLDEAKKNYYAGLGMAQERYSNFISAASSAMSSLTATPTPTDFAGTASSIASVARESASSALNAAEQAAESVYSDATENVASAIQAVDQGIYSAIDAATEQMYLTGAALADTWDNVVGQLNGQIYGEQKQLGWYDSLFNDASSAASAATAAVADQATAATDAAGDNAVAAQSEAAKQYSAVNNLVSELVSGKEPSFTESVLSRLNAVYATAASNIGSYASEASEAASSVGGKVNSAVNQAAEAVKETVQNARDEL
ncbi:uncharacterized protein J7T54_006999 [Emericellopsis cladophorae]|uniref:Transcription factor hoxa13 n=1 Tax=Emericellopsis cladophorae TaxID=2686198 RepID=A0A9Q0BGU0_9HYPO|nr:uncharacterized protein J7T54_006999 [Emericellopsis cladophorae]KAI6785357.1 hypothetical protein J7T54_006999 [Emericellopsis cladophorae]